MNSSIRSILLSSIFFLKFFSPIINFCSHKEKEQKGPLKIIVDDEPVHSLHFLQDNHGSQTIQGVMRNGVIIAHWAPWYPHRSGIISCIKIDYRKGSSTLPDSVFFLLRTAYKQKEKRDRVH